MNKNSLTAIDFETAAPGAGVVCSVGLAKIVDGKLVDTYSSLIMPPGGMPDRWCFKEIHGISPEQVLDAPSWIEVWKDILDFADGDTFAAHNARFDRGQLYAANRLAGLDDINYEFICTCNESRRLIPEHLENYKLPTVAHYFDVEQIHHHDAGDDAIVCGEIAAHLAILGHGKLQHLNQPKNR
ncbi:MAG: hypothetical protein LBM13_01120 [Candidatus Ancillula sp.]|nr:hypothetical protein [Candidatus Ancillula sp.]